KLLRKLQPDVMFRARGIGNYGDYYTPEGFVPGAKENTSMPWMVIYQLAGMWSYQPDATKYKGAPWIVTNLVDIVAKGGNFMVGIGPDARGQFHPKAVAALEQTGAWLRINGEAIYHTRPRPDDLWKEGKVVRFTRTKDHRFVYAICLQWPGQSLTLKSVRAKPGSNITLLGLTEPLPWTWNEATGLVIRIPAALQEQARRNLSLAYAFKIEEATPDAPATKPRSDAELPAGLSLDWDQTRVVTVNAKRARASLNGLWRFRPAAEGIAEPPKAGWGYIKVPGSWQGPRRGATDIVSLGGGPEWKGYDGTRVARAWYERQVWIPPEWQGRAISLRFDRVCTDAIIYVNGKECGRIAWPWGSVDITSAVTPGQRVDVQVLVAAIADADQVGTFWQNAFMNVTYAPASLRSRGLTGSVFLESRSSEAHVTDVFVRTSTRKHEVSLDVELTGVQQAGPVRVVADMLNEKGAVEKTFAADTAVPPKATQTLTFSWPWTDPRLWEVGQPNLYRLRLKMRGPGLDDEYNQKFGFREFWRQGRQLYLNGTVIHLRQPCFYNGPRGQVGDNFSELGSDTVDTRGDASDSERSLDDADRTGYLVAEYILNANKYLLRRGQFIWEQNRRRALERAAVWMRHYRNHPSIVMWIAGFNFFNNAVDADPRHIGRGGWGLADERWQRLMVCGRELFAGLQQLDSTRVYYSHAGADTGDLYTMNCYLDLLPLQEREDWLSAWADTGEMPISMVEFGTPMDCTFRRGRHGFESNITSEPLLTEFAAIYFGAAAYAAEEPKYRQSLHDLFRGGMLYQSSENRLDEYANNHSLQRLYRIHTWRSWRTAGLPGGLRTWSWMQDALDQVNGPTLAWIAGPPAAYTAKDHDFSSGQQIEKQIVLINDTRLPQPFTTDWTASVGGKVAGRGQLQGSLAVSEIRIVPLQIRAPVQESGGAADGQLTLVATIGGTRHQDTFGFRVFGKDKARGGRIAVMDPERLTTRMLLKLGYRIRTWNGGSTALLVIGRNAWKDNPAVATRLEPYVRAGGRALVFAQDPEWITRALGWRVCPKVARRVFPIPSAIAHSPLQNLHSEELRDWSGSSTLTAAYPEYVGNYLRGNEREQPYAGWHWGNRGGVSSAAIEKPHRSGWRPLLECEFDLAYSPLMELDYGQGRLIVCTLDLEDHVDSDPAARRVAEHSIDYALHSPLSPRASKVVYLGGAAGATWLDRIGVRYQPSATLDPGAGLWLVGPDATLDTPALTAYLENGGRIFFLPRSQADGWLGTTLKPAPAHFAGSRSVPDWPEARGLSASDLRWRCYLDNPPWILSGGAVLGADGLLGRKTIGNGTAVFCQVDPDCFHADEKTYFRYTRWRATRAVAQLLANLGASFAVDSRVFHPLDTWSLDLDGAWQMQVTCKLTPAPAESAAPADPGVTPAAQKLLEQTRSTEGWAPVTLPQMLPFFNDNDGEAVFRKQINTPQTEAEKDLVLSLGALSDFDNTFFNGVEIGHTDRTIANWRSAPRDYSVPGKLVKEGMNVIAVRLFNRFGPGGFAGQPGRPVGPDGDRSGPQATGPRVGLEMSLRRKPEGSQILSWYHPDYRTDFPMGDNPYRYYRW
ncbi:MAG: alpha-L-fucosidase, partial [Verrucomicrobia bacterium]|nr:alpha-L-fucosidase [Verrucomicrobiota bacterium]